MFGFCFLGPVNGFSAYQRISADIIVFTVWSKEMLSSHPDYLISVFIFIFLSTFLWTNDSFVSIIIQNNRNHTHSGVYTYLIKKSERGSKVRLELKKRASDSFFFSASDRSETLDRFVIWKKLHTTKPVDCPTNRPEIWTA